MATAAAPRRARTRIADKVKLTSPKLPPPVKPPPKLWGNAKNISRIGNQEIGWEGTGNCGLVFANDIGGTIRSIEDAYALRRAISNEMWNSVGSKWGAVCCTTTQGQRVERTYLRGAGFEQLFSFKNPNTQNTITVWSALAIEDEQEDEESANKF